MSLFVGIDLGTSAVKVLVLRDDGTTVAKTSAAYPLKHPTRDRTEQSVGDWWNALGEACREAMNQADPGDVESVALSGQLNGLVLLDEHLQPLDDAWIWLDLRAAELAAELERRHGALYRETVVNPANPIYVGTKLAWLRRERPDLADRVAHVLLAKDVMNLRLTGAVATDHSDASCTLLYDVRRGDWDPRLLHAAATRRELLPEIRPSEAVIGTVTDEAATHTGLPAGIPVAAGAGDVAALALGTGAIDVGTYAITLGTAGHVVSVARGVDDAGYDKIWQMRHPLPDRVIRLGLVMSGGLCLQWFAKTYASAGAAPSPADYESVLQRAAQAPAGSRGVTFLPFLEGAATPFQDPTMTAGFAGLRTHHGFADTARAVLEGVAYNVRDSVSLLESLGTPAASIRLSEGGSQSPLWSQILADVLQRPVVTLRERDSSALGAALLARHATRAGDLGEGVEAVLHGIEDRRYEPSADVAARYDEGYARYRRLATR
jgi:xylulokinase